MKQLLLFACLSLFTVGLSAQTVFVDIDAAGTGDGTSWADAYTNLNDALLAAAAGSEVWIADGTYITPDSASFFVNKELTILGGFNGTETEASAADPATNVTILSGDVMQNDVEGSFDTLSRLDNQPIMVFQDTNQVSTFTVTLDGVTLENGSIRGFTGGGILNFSGGGLLALARTDASRVTFRHNSADFGAALAVLLNGEGSSFTDVNFEDNYNGFDYTVYVRLTRDVTFTNCSFTTDEDASLSGFVRVEEAPNTTFDKCSFADMNTPGDRGGAINTANTLGVLLDSCSFTNISADIGGAVYMRNDSAFMDSRVITTDEGIVSGCTFEQISSRRWGGVIFMGDIGFTVENTTINDVDAITEGQGIGGGIYSQQIGIIPLAMDIENVTISNVDCNSNGGGMYLFTKSEDQISMANLTIDNCSAVGAAGGIFLRGTGPAAAAENVTVFDNVTITNCVANTTAAGGGSFGGGLLSLFQDIVVTKSTFTNNSTADNGFNGGGLYAEGDGISVTVRDSEFSGNLAAGGSGLAINGTPQTTTITNSTFDGNGSTAGLADRGGALYLLHGDSDINIDGCEFLNNSTVAGDRFSGGGAIYMLSFSRTPTRFNLTNSQIEANVCAGTNNGEGGGLVIINDIDATIDNTDFISNSASSGGAMITAVGFIRDTVDNIPMTMLPEHNVSVSNSRIINNVAQSQGGAVATFSTITSFSNSIFAFNQALENGGGAIIYNGVATETDAEGTFQSSAPADLSADIISCTFYGNTATTVGDAIAFNQAENTFNDTIQALNLTLQNNIFFVTEDDHTPLELEDADINGGGDFGTVNLTTLGGNFYNAPNDAMIDIIGTQDILMPDLDDGELVLDLDDEEDPNFLSLIVTDPESDNPLIDAGTTGPLVPAVGINGNPRGETPDIGAAELEWSLTNVREIEESGLDMSFFPNPTADVLNIESRDATIQHYNVVLTDANGRVLRNNRFNGTVNQINFTALPAGVYNLQLEVNGNVYSKQIVKQ